MVCELAGECAVVPTVHNVVAGGKLSVPLDTEELSRKLKAVRFDERAKAAVFKVAVATVRVYRTGRVSVAGAKSEAGAREAADAVVQRVRETVPPSKQQDVALRDFRVSSVAATGAVGFPLRLEAVRLVHPSQCTYVPEVNPAATFKLESPKVTARLFVSGKVTILGAKSESAVHDAYRQLQPLLKEYEMVRYR
ncbi:unnamed protein product [Pedinophyceae sp. YPF-701]|nr:unnamed protein product [Pedinophyceae sp. YPF-701]